MDVAWKESTSNRPRPPPPQSSSRGTATAPSPKYMTPLQIYDAGPLPALSRGPGTILKLGGGGGQTSPWVQCNPYPKLKTPRISPAIFLGTKVYVQKQAKIKMNDINSPKLEGRRPSGPKVGGASVPAASPLVSRPMAPSPKALSRAHGVC